MAGLYVKQDGVWKLPRSIWVKSGTWRVCNNVYIKEDGSWREMIKSVDLDSSKQNFNLYEYVGSPAQPLSLIFNVGSGKEITSNNTKPSVWKNFPPRTPAFTVGNFPAGSTVIINNNGYITGGGGFGGGGGNNVEAGTFNGQLTPVNGYTGGKGGDGMVKGSSNNFDCTLVNTGTVAGGGDGGNGGRSSRSTGPFGTAGVLQGGNGGDGAGITGYSRTQGGTGQPKACSTYNGNTQCSTAGTSGKSLGESGKAVVGVDIAVSGTIIGAVS